MIKRALAIFLIFALLSCTLNACYDPPRSYMDGYADGQSDAEIEYKDDYNEGYYRGYKYGYYYGYDAGYDHGSHGYDDDNEWDTQEPSEVYRF